MATAGCKDGKVFYGWWVVLAAGIGSFMSYGPIIAFTFGVFIKPLNEEFGWNRADISLGFSLSLLMLSGTAPLLGRLVDRFGARRVIVPSVLMFGSGVIQDLPGSEEYRREEWSLNRTTQHWYTAALLESPTLPDHKLVGLQQSAG